MAFENDAVFKNDAGRNLASDALRNQFAGSLKYSVPPSYTPEQLAALGDRVLTVLDGDGDGNSRFSIVMAPDKSSLDSHETARQTMRKLETQAGQSLNWLAVSSETGGKIDIEIIASGTDSERDKPGTSFIAKEGWLVSAEAGKSSSSSKDGVEPAHTDNPEGCRKLLTDYLSLEPGAGQEEINHRIAARSRQLADDTTAEELLEVFRRERLSAYFSERGMDSRGLTVEQMEQLMALDMKNAIPPETTDAAADGLSDIMQGAESFYGLPPGSNAGDLQSLMDARDAAIAGLPANTPKETVEQTLDNLYRARHDRDEYLRGIGLSEQADMEASANLRRDRLLENGYPAEMANTEEGIAILDALARREQARRLGLPEEFDASVFPTEKADGKTQDRKHMAKLLGLPEDVTNRELDSASADVFGQCAASVEDLASGRYIEFPGGE